MRSRLIPLVAFLVGLGTTVFIPESALGASDWALVGPLWYWQGSSLPSDREIQPADPFRYTVQFRNDGSLVARVDCNRTLGTYTSADDALSLRLGPTTLIACPPWSLAGEYVGQLQRVQRYSVAESELLLELSGESGTMRFTLTNGS